MFLEPTVKVSKSLTTSTQGVQTCIQSGHWLNKDLGVSDEKPPWIPELQNFFQKKYIFERYGSKAHDICLVVLVEHYLMLKCLEVS